MTFSQMFEHINQTWDDQPSKVRAIAARYYIGAETLESLRAYSLPRIYDGTGHSRPGLLTEEQIQLIIDRR